jgi:hypothetical protein
VTAPLAALVAALVLTGCSPDAEPSPMPTPSSPSTSDAAEPAPTPPTMPAQAEGTSPDAAKAFARYFVQTINFAMSTGDTSPLRTASADACATCRAIADKIDESHAGPAFLEGRGWRPRGFQYVRVAADEALVAVPVRISAQKSYASTGAQPTETVPSRGNLDLRMSWSTGRWLVTQLDASQ